MSTGVVLHEEHIELLTEDYKQLKKEVEGKTLLEGSLHFAGKKQELYLHFRLDRIIIKQKYTYLFFSGIDIGIIIL